MPKIRAAQKKDTQDILSILESMDLYHPSRIPEDFHIAEIENKIAGLCCLTDYGDFLFLSSVGVIPEHQKKGVARAMLQRILSDSNKDTYLYTIIPEFFKKLGFKIADAPDFLPPRRGLGCEDCRLPNCVCMRLSSS